MRHGPARWPSVRIAGGGGATLVDLTPGRRGAGRALAPVPWIDHVVATRLWSDSAGGPRSGGRHPDRGAGPEAGGQHGPAADRFRVRWPTGSSFATVTTILLGHDARPARSTIWPGCRWRGSIPLRRSAGGAGFGPQAVTEYVRAHDEWRVLTAALAGLVEQTMTTAEFAKSRFTPWAC